MQMTENWDGTAFEYVKLPSSLFQIPFQVFQTF